MVSRTLKSNRNTGHARCGGPEFLFIRAERSSRQLLDQNHTGIMHFQCPLESKIRQNSTAMVANFGFWTPANLPHPVVGGNCLGESIMIDPSSA
jgi:hypothetical protein